MSIPIPAGTVTGLPLKDVDDATFRSIAQAAGDVPVVVTYTLTADDLKPSKTRKKEQMWQQIVGNATGSHAPTSVSIFAKGYAVKTRDGIRVTDAGAAYLKSKGF